MIHSYFVETNIFRFKPKHPVRGIAELKGYRNEHLGTSAAGMNVKEVEESIPGAADRIDILAAERATTFTCKGINFTMDLI